MVDTSTPGKPAPPSHAGTTGHAAPESTSAGGELEALRSRLGRLLLADPVKNESPETAERIGRRAQQIRGYLETSRAALAAPEHVGIGAGSRTAGMESPRRPSDPSGRPRDSQSDTASLIEALDAYLADPASASLRSVLEHTIETVIGPLPEPPHPGPEHPSSATNAVGTRNASRPETPARVELHRLDEAERDWWRNRFARLQRRVTVGLVLSAGALIGVGALYLDSGDHRPSSVMPSHPGPPGSPPAPFVPMAPTGIPADTPPADLPSGMDALYRLLQQLGTTPEGLAALIKDWSDGPAATLEALRERSAELDVKIMQLDARLSAWENSQPSAPVSRASQTDMGDPVDTAQTLNTSGATTPAPTPVHSLDSSQPAFGIQLATLRSQEDTQAFARRSGLDFANLYIETTGKNQMLILGFYPSADQAQSALAALPPALHTSRPIVRTFQAPADLSALEIEQPSPIFEREKSVAKPH